jgi:Ser/Thr protein kinase RdoA (MazF antagonist)
MSHDPAEWSAQSAADIAQRAIRREQFGGPDRPSLVKFGLNAVFRTGAGPDTVIVKVARPEYDLAHLQRQLELAIWLSDVGFPTSRPLRTEVLLVDGIGVTFWRYIESAPTAPIAPRSLGALLRRFHDATDSYPQPLPLWDPIKRLGDHFDGDERGEHLSTTQRHTLTAARDRLAADALGGEFVLPAGPQHGDFHPANILSSTTGLALIDFDWIAHGPREWDLTSFFAGATLFGRSEADLEPICEGYGWDPRGTPGFDALVELRALAMLTWLLNMPDIGRVTDEIQRRILYWTDRDHAPVWRAV